MKKGFSASGRKTAKLEVVGPVGTTLKRARCFGMSFTVAINQGGLERGERAQLTPVLAAIPDTLLRADVDTGDAPIGALLTGIGKTSEGHDELVVGANWRILVMCENDASMATFPLREAIHKSKCRGV